MAASARWCAALLIVIASAHAQQNTAPKTYVVTMENMAFDPASLTVRRGDRIVWVNKDLFPHTATADRNAFDSGDIAAQASWTYVAVTPGVFEYTCRYHPTMKATITVR